MRALLADVLAWLGGGCIMLPLPSPARWIGSHLLHVATHLHPRMNCTREDCRVVRQEWAKMWADPAERSEEILTWGR